MKILHSFPTKEKKFKWFNDLTFSIKNIENFYVDKLKDYKYSINDLDLIVIHSLSKSEISFLNNNSNLSILLGVCSFNVFVVPLLCILL